MIFFKKQLVFLICVGFWRKQRNLSYVYFIHYGIYYVFSPFIKYNLLKYHLEASYIYLELKINVNMDLLMKYSK